MSGCTNRSSVNEKKIIRFADALLRHLLDTADWSVLYGDDSQASTVTTRLAAVQAEIDDTRTRVQALVAKQVASHVNVMDTYDAPIQQLGDVLDALLAERERLTKAAENAAPTQTQTLALAELRELGLEAFWQQERAAINQHMHRLMGNYRFVIRGREVVGLSTHKRTKKGVRRKRSV